MRPPGQRGLRTHNLIDIPQQPDTGWSVTRTGTPMGDPNYERRKRAFVEQPFAEATQTHHKLTEDANGNPTGVAAVPPGCGHLVHHPATGRPDLRPAGEDRMLVLKHWFECLDGNVTSMCSILMGALIDTLSDWGGPPRRSRGSRNACGPCVSCRTGTLR